MQSAPVFTVEDGMVGSFLDSELGLGSMWRACSRASDFLENGKRLENLSWRLWNHQTLHLQRRRRPSASSSSTDTDTEVLEASTTLPLLSIPDLSSASTDSISSIEQSSLEKLPAPKQRRRKKRLLERQVTPVELDNLVHTIKESQDLKEPLPSLPYTDDSICPSPLTSHDTPRPSSPRPVLKQDSSASTNTMNTSSCLESLTSPGSDTSATSALSAHSVVRGFVPGTGVSSYTSRSQLAPLPAPILKSSSGGRAMLKKKGGMFMLGGSSGEDESSLRDRMSPRPAAPTASPHSKKQTSFKDQVDEISTAHDVQSAAVFDSDEDEDEEDEDDYDDEDDDLSEDVIDEDDEDDEDDDEAWEDEAEDDSKPEPFKFQRIDSTANLTSRRSQLTLAFERSISQGNLTNSRSTPALRRSRVSTPNGPSMPQSPEDEDEDEGSPLQMRKSTRPQRIQTTTNTDAAVHSRVIPMSPRTTRQKMLAGEMTESFRKQLLWERKQRNIYSTQASAAASMHHARLDQQQQQQQQQQSQFRRAATASDLPNLARRADAPVTKEQLSLGRGRTGGDWNHYFDNESMAGYHQKGW